MTSMTSGFSNWDKCINWRQTGGDIVLGLGLTNLTLRVWILTHAIPQPYFETF